MPEGKCSKSVTFFFFFRLLLDIVLVFAVGNGHDDGCDGGGGNISVSAVGG